MGTTWRRVGNRKAGRAARASLLIPHSPRANLQWPMLPPLPQVLRQQQPAPVRPPRRLPLRRRMMLVRPPPQPHRRRLPRTPDRPRRRQPSRPIRGSSRVAMGLQVRSRAQVAVLRRAGTRRRSRLQPTRQTMRRQVVRQSNRAARPSPYSFKPTTRSSRDPPHPCCTKCRAAPSSTWYY